MDGYIKLNRKILGWEWYSDPNTKILFLHCLLKANWKDGKFLGQDVKRGSFVTSLSSLSDETGLSIQSVRTALEHLKSTGEITVKATNKYRIVTITNYDYYQADDKQKADKAESEILPFEVKEEKKEKKEKAEEPRKMYGEYKHVRLKDSEYNRLVKDYGEDAVLRGIKNVDEYCQQHGKTYKDYNLTLRNWGIKEPKLNTTIQTDEGQVKRILQ